MIGEELRLVLIDFGLSYKGISTQSKVGTERYMAPEITGNDSYTDKVDVWSIGIIIF